MDFLNICGRPEYLAWVSAKYETSQKIIMNI